MKKSDAKTRREVVRTNKNINGAADGVAYFETSKKGDNKNVYQCVLCEQKFTEHSLMIEHFRQHGERKQIGSSGPTTNFGESVDNRSSDQMIRCEWCSEVFVTISKAIEHKFRKHRYESTNYFCPDCGKLFPLKVALKQHSQIEHKKSSIANESNGSSENDCSFACKYCDVSFSTLNAVTFHENGAHQMEQRLQNFIILPPASKKVKVNNQGEVTTLYYCHLCGNEYMVKYNLMKHLDLCHTTEEKANVPPEGVIKCRACEAIFYNSKAYNVHNIQHKPDDLYVTSEEQRQKVVCRVDQDFDISRVPTLPLNTLTIPKAVVNKLKRIPAPQSNGNKLKKNKSTKSQDVD